MELPKKHSSTHYYRPKELSSKNLLNLLRLLWSELVGVYSLLQSIQLHLRFFESIFRAAKECPQLIAIYLLLSITIKPDNSLAAHPEKNALRTSLTTSMGVPQPSGNLSFSNFSHASSAVMIPSFAQACHR